MRGTLGKLSAVAWNIFPVLQEIEPVAEERSEKYISPNGKFAPIRSIAHEGMNPKARERVREEDLVAA